MKPEEVKQIDEKLEKKLAAMKAELRRTLLVVSSNPATWDNVIVGMAFRVVAMDRTGGNVKLTLAPTFAAPPHEPGTAIEIRIDSDKAKQVNKEELYAHVKQLVDFLDAEKETVSMAELAARFSCFFDHPETDSRMMAIFWGISRDDSKFFGPKSY